MQGCSESKSRKFQGIAGTGKKLAPVCGLRLCIQCQCRKTDGFLGWKPTVFSEVCHWDGDYHVFWATMTQTYLPIDGDASVAHDWAKTNNYIVSVVQWSKRWSTLIRTCR